MIMELFLLLFRMNLRASLLIMAVIIFRIFKKYSRIYTYCLWLLVCLRLLCPAFIESSFSLLPASTKVTQDNFAARRLSDYSECRGKQISASYSGGISGTV